MEVSKNGGQRLRYVMYLGNVSIPDNSETQ